MKQIATLLLSLLAFTPAAHAYDLDSYTERVCADRTWDDEIGWVYQMWWLEPWREGYDPEPPMIGPYFGECVTVRQGCEPLGDGDCRIYTSCITETPNEISLITEDVKCAEREICGGESMDITPGWAYERAWEWLVDIVEGDEGDVDPYFGLDECIGDDVWTDRHCVPLEPGSDLCEVSIYCFPEQEPGESGKGVTLAKYVVECAEDPLCELVTP